jgi:hypothetical protein
MGGPFGHHRAEPLPYYTLEMHQSYLKDAKEHRFQVRINDTMGAIDIIS